MYIKYLKNIVLLRKYILVANQKSFRVSLPSTMLSFSMKEVLRMEVK